MTPSVAELGKKLILACCTGSISSLRGLLNEAPSFPPQSLPTDQYLLQTAAREGQADCLRFLFDHLPGCARTPNKWDPPLPEGLTYTDIPKKWRIYDDGVIHEAIAGQNPVGIFEVFFDYEMSPDISLERAGSPLAQAVARNQLDLATYLLSKGADPNEDSTFNKDTILGAAARLPTPDLLLVLLEHRASVVGSQALRQAAQYGRIRNAEILLQNGANVDEMFTKSKYDANMKPTEVPWGCALHFAVGGGVLHYEHVDSQSEFVRFLLQQGARVDCLDEAGETPLQKAKRLIKTDIVEVFEDFSSQE
ncbi:hypothetical protein AK830_g11415 [Neonectria ditissima]|uniref:Uncharacterized protein n=1 Tax=Neonectria ditissima TaxID=78410 RepID=A0A0P7ACY8_9HYPO|nr:hypothetical protein AK830_g11415 [Neonectria ditissima]